MKSSWDIKPLSEVCTFYRGLTYKKSDEDESSSSIVLRANNIDLHTNSLNFAELKRIKDNIPIPDSKKLKKGSLLICTASGSKAHLGKVALIDADYGYAFGGFMGQLTPTDSLASKYFYYWLTSDRYRKFIDELADGANINNLKFSQLEKFQIPLPPLPEQKRIVAMLDEAFAGIDTAIANTERNLANARELFESYLNAVFTKNESAWRKIKLESVCEKITVGHVGPMASRYKSEGVPLLRSQNIRPFYVDLNRVVFIDKDFHTELKKSALQPGDLGIVRTGYPGTAAVIPESLPVANCSDLVIVRPGERVLSDFLAIVFNSYYGKKEVAGVLVGAAQKHFNVTAAKAAMIPLPGVDEQRRVVAACSDLRGEYQRLESIYQQKLNALAELKQSLLQKAFSGELTADTVDSVDTAAAVLA